MDMTKFYVYSLGEVAVNKKLDSRLIEVTPTEHLSFVDGQLTDNLTTQTSQGTDAQGNAYTTSVDTSVTVEAEWLNFTEPNRTTAPDVRRGESVLIWRYADSDKFWWTCNVARPDLRKLETIVHAYSDTTDESVKSGPDTTYYMEISTHRGIIHIHTSKSNGEPFVYDMQLNCKDGSFLFQDDIGNYWSMDSKNVRHEFKNSDGSWIDMNRKIINIFAPDTVNITADKGNINMKAGTDITHNAGSNITSKAGATITLDAGSSYALKTGTTATINAGSTISTKSTGTTNVAPMTTFQGNVTVSAMLLTMSMSAGAGGGSFTVNSPGIFTKPVTVNQLTSTNAIIAPNIR